MVRTMDMENNMSRVSRHVHEPTMQVHGSMHDDQTDATTRALPSYVRARGF
jgi:hypothetical protein